MDYGIPIGFYSYLFPYFILLQNLSIKLLLLKNRKLNKSPKSSNRALLFSNLYINKSQT